MIFGYMLGRRSVQQEQAQDFRQAPRRHWAWQLALAILISMCLLAWIGGIETRKDAEHGPVPINTVAPGVCLANGAVTQVVHYPSESGVYHVTCASGVVLTAPHAP